MCAWDPHTDKNKYNLEQIERRATRFVCRRYHNISSVTDMLTYLEWPILEIRHLQSRRMVNYFWI